MGIRADLPDWPRRMDAETAAAYLNIGETTFRARVDAKVYPQPIRDGGRVLWDRRALDLLVDAQSGFDNATGIEPW